MKHLLSGIAIVAAVAIAAPAWAQGARPSGGGHIPSSPPPAAAPMHRAPMVRHYHHRPARHHHWAGRHHRHWHKRAAGDMETQKLNQEELARIQAGAHPAPAPKPPALQGPRASGGGHIKSH